MFPLVAHPTFILPGDPQPTPPSPFPFLSVSFQYLETHSTQRTPGRIRETFSTRHAAITTVSLEPGQQKPRSTTSIQRRLNQNYTLNYNHSKPRCPDTSVETQSTETRTYVPMRAQLHRYSRPWKMEYSWSPRQGLQDGLSRYIIHTLKEDRNKSINEIREHTNQQWNEENSLRSESRNGTVEETSNWDKIRNEKFRNLNKNLRGKPLNRVQEMEERISVTEDKVEEMLSVMGKENVKCKKSWLYPGTKGYCSAKGKHDLNDSRWHPIHIHRSVPCWAIIRFFLLQWTGANRPTGR